MQLIKGKVVADEIKVEIAEEVRQLTSRGVKKPHLAAVLVGNDGASKTYVAR
ncbi:MAG: tetrahydrofolate dehydrogenase/cyclohydrolase catalytic domain-containing protein, partial [Vicingaceae bacterium]